MARHKQPSRTSRKPKRRNHRPAQVTDTNQDYDLTIREWCAKRRVSRGLFYAMMKAGTAPKTIKLNKCRRITHAADAEWQAEREREVTEAA